MKTWPPKSRHIRVERGVPLVIGEARDVLQKEKCKCGNHSDCVVLRKGLHTKAWLDHGFYKFVGIQVPGEPETLCRPCFEKEVADENVNGRIAELEGAIRALAFAAYRDGCTTMVYATALDKALALVGLPRVEGREPGVTDTVVERLARATGMAVESVAHMAASIEASFDARSKASGPCACGKLANHTDTFATCGSGHCLLATVRRSVGETSTESAAVTHEHTLTLRVHEDVWYECECGARFDDKDGREPRASDDALAAPEGWVTVPLDSPAANAFFNAMLKRGGNT